MNRDFHQLTVAETRKEIGGQAKSVMFDVPDALKGKFTWRPGQHLTLRFRLGDGEVRRSYTISSSPVSGDPLRITVKRVKGGLVSNHINDRVSNGDVIDVMPPFGGFCLDPGKNQRRTHYFFGAGSGITPLYSMLHSVLLGEPYSVVHLFYGNHKPGTIIFHDQLAALQEQYGDRLTVSHVISSPPLLSSFEYWRRGVIDDQAIEAAIAENPPYAQDAQYYICGPSGMNDSVKTALMNLDVPTDRIHMESYGAREVVADDNVAGVAAQVDIRLDGERHRIAVAKGQTILEAARAAGIDPPFSCESGVCGACQAELRSGNVHMRAHMALEDHEVAAGQILTCQAVAKSNQLELVYD